MSVVAHADMTTRWTCTFNDYNSEYLVQTEKYFTLADQAIIKRGNLTDRKFVVISDNATEPVAGGITSSIGFPEVVSTATGD